jgi:hypothetical protein
MFPADDPHYIPDPGQVIDAEREVRLLRRDFPRYEIELGFTPSGARYTAQRMKPGPGPHTVITKDPIELRAELSGQTAPVPQL